MRRHRRISAASSDQRPTWQRDVRLLASSRGISMAGAEAGHIALLALAWHLTGSASQASLVLLAAVFARTLGAPLSGWIGDHCDRRRVIIGGELGVAVSLCAMAASQSMPQLLVACVFHAFAASTCGSALDASVASLVPANDLSKANSTLGMARTAGHMLGPVLGGLAVAGFGARSAFLLDATSSVIAAVLVIGIRGCVGGSAAARSEAGHDASSEDRSMLAGMRVLATDPVLRLLAAGWAGMCVCFAFITAAELPLAVEFGMDEPGLGMIVSSWCAGSLLGSWLARRVNVEQRGPRVLVYNALACSVVFAATGLVPAFWCVLVLMAIGGFSMSLADVVEMTIIQQRVEDGVRARVLAAYGALFSAIWGTNLAIAGLFVDAFSPGAAYVYGGVWCLVGAIGFTALGVMLRRQLLQHTLRVMRPRHALETELAESA
ncbi:MAG: transporter [Thermoleophilia bacterium]|nr:transporter [Thermoleophilia bacterium]